MEATPIKAQVVSHEEVKVTLKQASDYWSERCLGEISSFECAVDEKLAKHQAVLEENMLMFAAMSKNSHELKNEVRAAKLTFSAAHAALTGDFRELMARVNNAANTQQLTSNSMS